jgi:hypothetical protein
VTHGERWFQKAVARMTGYCKAKRWRMSEVERVAKDEWQFDVYDKYGHRGEIAFGLSADKCYLIDEYGISPDYLSAELFERMLPELQCGKVKPNKRQLELTL